VALGERIIPTNIPNRRHILVFWLAVAGLVGDEVVANNSGEIPLRRIEPRTASTVSLGSVIAIVTFLARGRKAFGRKYASTLTG
jgi:hypothetical protein